MPTEKPRAKQIAARKARQLARAAKWGNKGPATVTPIAPRIAGTHNLTGPGSTPPADSDKK